MEEFTRLKRTERSDEWFLIRKKALIRDEYKCVLCGTDGNEVDHIKPLCLGGTNELDNLQTLCSVCHRKKTNSDIRKNSALKKYAKYKKVNKLFGGGL